jgi:protein SCO1/2
VRPGDRNTGRHDSGVQKGLWGLLALALIAVVGFGTWTVLLRGRASRQTLSVTPELPPAYGSVPEFSLIERSGRRIERGELLGRVWVVDLIYTRCPDTCPLQSAEMAKLQAGFVGDIDVRLVSITVDPARDTPQVLSRYANRFRADPGRWLFLTGRRDAIYRFAQEGLRLPLLDPRDKGRAAGHRVATAGERQRGEVLLHSSRFVLVDRQARIRGYYESRDAESLRRLREDVKLLLGKD